MLLLVTAENYSLINLRFFVYAYDICMHTQKREFCLISFAKLLNVILSYGENFHKMYDDDDDMITTDLRKGGRPYASH